VVGTYNGDSSFSFVISEPFDEVANGGTPAERFTLYVSRVYQDVLGRNADAPGLNYWVQQLEAGGSRQQVAAGIWESAEHRGLEVDKLYATYLHRDADPSGRAGWVNKMLAGASETDVALGLVTSSEYMGAHAGPESFVTALFSDGLGRSPDPSGLAFWEQVAQNPSLGPGAVALGILTSPEAYTRLVDQYYLDYLKRSSDASGLQSWLADLQSNRLSPTGVAEGFLTSDEYFARATGS
jgi:hypothetical protein